MAEAQARAVRSADSALRVDPARDLAPGAPRVQASAAAPMAAVLTVPAAEAIPVINTDPPRAFVLNLASRPSAHRHPSAAPPRLARHRSRLQ